MTSKEGLEMLCDLCNTNVNCYQKKQCTIYKAIAKDLEVLEILKRIVKIVDCSKHPVTSLDNQLVILSGGEIKNVEDYDKIKGWLENDK